MTLPAHPRVLVTRASSGGSELAEYLRGLGAEPVLVPAITIAPPASFEVLDQALSNLEGFHWLVFTSANAVEVFLRRMELLSEFLRNGPLLPSRLPSRPRIAVIGPATGRALERAGLSADLVPKEAVAEALTAALLPHVRPSGGAPTRLLLVRAEVAREYLPDTLRAAGAEVTIAPAYRTEVPAGSADRLRSLFSEPGRGIQAITFTSSSTARNLLALCEAAQVTLPEDVLRVSIGPITSQTLRELGLPPHAEAPEATVASLAATALTALRGYK